MTSVINKLFKKNKTIIEYIKTKNERFSEMAFNDVDGLILAQFSYINFNGLVDNIENKGQWVPISSLYKAEKFDAMVDNTFFPNLNLELIAALCASPRYRDIGINFYMEKYDKDMETQFAAVSFLLPTDEIVVAFRGTDTTIIGWKEDFNMFHTIPVPGHLSAVSYLKTIASITTNPFYMVGHSKGGNLAIYSLATVDKEIQDRIITVYGYDNPGFIIDRLKDIKYKDIEDKVIKIMPEGSFVGKLFENIGYEKFVKSNQMDAMQHSAFTWEIENDSFVQSYEVTKNIRHIDKTFNTWMYTLDLSQRKLLVDTVFSAVDLSEVEKVSELAPLLIKERDNILKKIKKSDSETAAHVKEMLRELIKISITSSR